MVVVQREGATDVAGWGAVARWEVWAGRRDEGGGRGRGAGARKLSLKKKNMRSKARLAVIMAGGYQGCKNGGRTARQERSTARRGAKGAGKEGVTGVAGDT